MTPITGSPVMLAVSALVTVFAVFLGAMLALWVRRTANERAANVALTLRLFEEFHSPQFIAYRRRAHERLSRPDADGFVRTLPLCIDVEDDTRRDALLALAYFFEKMSVLWNQRKLDRNLLCGLLGRYVEEYAGVFFAADGGDAEDPEWGAWKQTLIPVFAQIRTQHRHQAGRDHG